MSLISDKQRENAQQPKPTIKPIQVTNESLDLGTAGTGQEFQLSQQEPISPELPEIPSAATPEPALDFSLTQPTATNVEGGFSPKDPRELFTGGRGRSIWEKVPDDKPTYAPEILQTLKPTTYDSSLVNSNAAALNASGMAGVRSSLDNYSEQQRKAAQAEADFRDRLNNRAENTNIPRKQQPWGSMVGQAFNDLLFGSKQSQEEAQRSVVNPFKLQYGKQGAGVGGWAKYVLGLPLNATVALGAQGSQFRVDVLKKFGVSDADAKRYANTGLLGVALDKVFGKDKTDALGKRFGLQQDWSKTDGRNAVIDTIVRGESYGDINDPKGNSKGVFYREARPRRTEAETQAASLGKYDIIGAGGIIQAAKDDPVGAGYEILINLIDPVGNKVGDIVGAGIRNIGKAPTPKPAPAKGVQTTAVFYPSKKPQRALPPGKVQGTPVEQQLEQLWGNQIPKPPRAPGEARLPPAPTQNLPLLPGTPPAGGFPKINLGDGIPVTGTRVIAPDEGYLPSGATRNKPKRFVSFPSDEQMLAEQAAKNDPWNSLNESPIQMGATLESAAESSAPKLKPGKFTAEQISSPWDDKVDFIDVAFEPITSAASTPTKAPRIYQGDFRVVQKALPPAIDNVTDVIPEAIVGTPSEVVFRVGIGNPSAEPIVFNESINIAGVDDITTAQSKVQEFTAPNAPPAVPKATTEQLEQAAEQLSSHKAVIQAPLQQLDQLFDETVDFGRKVTDEIPHTQLTPDSVYEALENNAKLNLPPETYLVLGKRYGDEVAEALRDADYINLSDLITQKQIDLETFVKEVAEVNNGIVNGKATAAKPKPTTSESPTQQAKVDDVDPEAAALEGKTSDDFNDYTGLPEVVVDNLGYYNPPRLTNIKWRKGRRINPQAYAEIDLIPEPQYRVLFADLKREFKEDLMRAMETGEPAPSVNLGVFDYGSPYAGMDNGGIANIGLGHTQAKAKISVLREMGFTDVSVTFDPFKAQASLGKYASRGSKDFVGDNSSITKFTRSLKPKTKAQLAKEARVAQLAKENKELNELLSVAENERELGYGLEPDEVARLKLLQKAEDNDMTVEEYLASKSKKKTKAKAEVKPDASSTTAKLEPEPAKVAAEQLRNTIKMPTKVLHGTALANWQPSYNLRLNGSRGELGSGLYVTNRASVATDYAKAVISENVSPGANAKDIAPAIHELSHTFEQTFSARGKLGVNDPIVKAIVSSLPEQLQEAVRKSLSRDSSTNLVGILNKIEASLVRSSLSPTEEVLKDVNLRVSDALRSLGYDSIYDTKSGFGLVLDETKVSISKSKQVPPASSPTQAALARYNADAYAAKFYQERLTTDANLRDSAYKLLSQLESNVDDKLREVQQEIIKRGLQEQSTVLPPKTSFKQGVSLNDSKPNTISEVLDTIEPKSTNPCEF